MPADGGFDEIAEEHAQVAQHDHRQAQQQHGHRGAAAIARPARVRRRPHEIIAEDGQDEDAVDDADQPQVEPHVAVEDMAELVPQHALQFFAVEVSERAGRDGHHRVARVMSGGEGVDRWFVVHDEHGRNGDARGQGHFLDHVQQPPFGQIGGLRIDGPSAEHQRDLFAARREFGDFVKAAQGDDQTRSQGNPEEQRGIPERRGDARLVILLVAAVLPMRVAGVLLHHTADARRGQHQVNRQDNGNHGQSEQHDEFRSLPPGVVLALEEVRCHGMSPF